MESYNGRTGTEAARSTALRSSNFEIEVMEAVATTASNPKAASCSMFNSRRDRLNDDHRDVERLLSDPRSAKKTVAEIATERVRDVQQGGRERERE